MLGGSTTAKTPKKPKGQGNAADSAADSEAGDTRRGSRSKNSRLPNPVASVRGTESAVAQGKKTSLKRAVKEILVPIKDQDNTDYERVVFIDNNSKKPTCALYRKIERAEPMSHL